MIYIRLYFEFFKIGLFSIGGGLATLPFVQQLIERYGWITNEDLLNMIAISESTPGPIGINVATFVGYNTAGTLGGIIATIGLVTPSVIIILLVAHYFIKFNQHPLVQGGLSGIRPAVAGLIAFVAFELGKEELFLSSNNIQDILREINFQAVILLAILLYLINRYKKHPILYLVGAGIAGVIFKY
ncbi:chromate transporter [Halonatronum saccharophilum]|uniref:chromate transporter n=1 Tax=Halonatronum saccharophilum TaxID=150060 RepID=UPI000487B21A|nr:chromate transporter [Halonatronum saccharophilum]